MKRRVYNAAYLINVIFQAFFNLLFPMGLLFVVGWLAVNKLGFPDWIYVILLVVGLISGLISMIKFLIYALDAFDSIEKAQKANRDKRNGRGDLK